MTLDITDIQQYTASEEEIQLQEKYKNFRFEREGTGFFLINDLTEIPYVALFLCKKTGIISLFEEGSDEPTQAMVTRKITVELLSEDLEFYLQWFLFYMVFSNTINTPEYIKKASRSIEGYSHEAEEKCPDKVIRSLTKLIEKENETCIIKKLLI